MIALSQTLRLPDRQLVIPTLYDILAGMRDRVRRMLGRPAKHAARSSHAA